MTSNKAELVLTEMFDRRLASIVARLPADPLHDRRESWVALCATTADADATSLTRSTRWPSSTI